MRLATSTNMIFERPHGELYEIEKCIKLCSEAGYKVMDLSFHDLTTIKSPFIGADWESYLYKLKAFADSNDVEFSQGHATLYDFCNPNEDHQLKDEWMRKSIKGAGIMGIKWLVIHPSTCYTTATPVQTSKGKNVKQFREYAEYAAQFNVGLALENMWDLSLAPKRRYTSNSEELVDLVDSIDRNNVGICWDVQHASIQEENQGLAIRHIGNRLKATHISDQTGLDNIHILPYQGVTDWDDVLQAFADIDYQGDFSYEMQHYLKRAPEELFIPALTFSYEVGQYLLNKIEAFKK